MEENNIAFNARAIFAWTADRLYRVYVRDDALYFIRTGGQGMATAVGAGFGMVGALVGQAIEKRSAAKRSARLAAEEREGLQTMLAGHKHNFRVSPGDIGESSIEPQPAFGGHGAAVGRWLLTLGDKKWTLEFPKVADMEVALAHLPRWFGDRLRVNVQWDERKKRYGKR